MTQKVDSGPSALDTVKLAAAVAILVGGIAAFYLLSSYPLALRWVIVLASLGAGIAVALQSVQGRTFWDFVQGSRVELRKVVWPTRKESWQTTWVVFAMIGVIGLLLFIFDSALSYVFLDLIYGGSR